MRRDWLDEDEAPRRLALVRDASDEVVRWCERYNTSARNVGATSGMIGTQLLASDLGRSARRPDFYQFTLFDFL